MSSCPSDSAPDQRHIVRVRALSEVRQPLLAALDRAQHLGFLGPKDIEVQLAHSVAFAELTARLLTSASPIGGVRIADLGSGGGIPGLVIMMLLPWTEVCFVDSSQKRMAILREQLQQLELEGRSSVVCIRAEAFGRAESSRGAFDAVVARGFAGPGVTAECAAPLLRPDGFLVVSDAPEEHLDRWPISGLRQLGLVVQERVSAPFHFFVGRQEADCPDRYPRRIGIPEKRPLF